MVDEIVLYPDVTGDGFRSADGEWVVDADAAVDWEPLPTEDLVFPIIDERRQHGERMWTGWALPHREHLLGDTAEHIMRIMAQRYPVRVRVDSSAEVRWDEETGGWLVDVDTGARTRWPTPRPHHRPRRAQRVTYSVYRDRVRIRRRGLHFEAMW